MFNELCGISFINSYQKGENGMKNIFQILMVVIISFGVIGGCGGIETNFRGVFLNEMFCVSSKDECKESKIRRECAGFKFKSDGGDMCAENSNYPFLCKLNHCCISSHCRKKSKSPIDEISSKDNSLTLFNIEQSCDLIAKGSFSADTEIECENLALDKECIDFEFIPTDEVQNIINECWLYECLLELPIIDEELAGYNDQFIY
jgi:hypothetical protein